MHGLSRFLSRHLSIAHTPPSISHPYSPPTISRGSLYHKHTLSPSPCVHVLHVSLSTFVPCWPDLYWTCPIGESLSIANNHALVIFVYLLTSLFYIGDACVICLHKKRKHTHTLSLSLFAHSLSLLHTHLISLNFGTLFGPEHIDLLKSQTSQSLTMYVEKRITSSTANIYH